MSLTKQEVKAGDYIDSPTKIKASKGTTKANLLKLADQLSTGAIIWLLVKRHKVGLLTIGNIILVLNWAIPAWPEIVKSLI